MSKLLKEWNRLAFGKGTRTMLNESPEEDASPLAPLREMGFFFAGGDSVVLGDLDDMSSREFSAEHPCDDPYEQGPFHVQISVDENGMFEIHDYTEINDRFCSGMMPKKGTKYNDLREVSYAINDMVKCYEEFMDAYQEIDAADAVTDEFYRYIDMNHPVAKGLMKK